MELVPNSPLSHDIVEEGTNSIGQLKQTQETSDDIWYLVLSH